MKSGEETRLVVETLMEVIPGTQIVAIVTTSGEPFEGLEMEPLISGNRAAAFERMEELVRAELSRSTVPEDLFVVIDGVEWGVLVNAIEAREGVVVGALIVAREGRVWSPPRALAGPRLRWTAEPRGGAVPAREQVDPPDPTR